MSAQQVIAMAIELRSDLSTSPTVVLGVLAGLAVTGVLTLVGSRPAAVALGAFGVLWLAVNGQVEGPLLLSVSPGHGVVAADLVGLAAVVVAMWRLAVPRRVATGVHRAR